MVKNVIQRVIFGRKMEFIEICDVYKNYHIGKKLISVIVKANCAIEQGDFVILLGPSGSGKTTLLNMLSGLDKPTSGSIYVNNQEISTLNNEALDDWRRRNIGIIFQNYDLMPYMSVVDNIALPSVFMGEPRKQRTAKARVLLRSVGLIDRGYQDVNLLSGGEQQRVAIARALINDPPILIADEPTGNLDLTNATEIMELIINFHKEQKTTILMSTHNPNYARYADKVIYIQDGDVSVQRNNV